MSVHLETILSNLSLPGTDLISWYRRVPSVNQNLVLCLFILRCTKCLHTVTFPVVLMDWFLLSLLVTQHFCFQPCDFKKKNPFSLFAITSSLLLKFKNFC